MNRADTIRYYLRDEFDDNSEAFAALDVLLVALTEAAVVLEVLTGQIKREPYIEMTGTFQGEIMRTTTVVREALAGGSEE